MLRLDAPVAKSYKLKLPDDYWEALARLSKQTGAPVAELLRRAAKDYLETHGETVTGEVRWGGERTPKETEDNSEADEP